MSKDESKLNTLEIFRNNEIFTSLDEESKYILLGKTLDKEKIDDQEYLKKVVLEAVKEKEKRTERAIKNNFYPFLCFSQSFVAYVNENYGEEYYKILNRVSCPSKLGKQYALKICNYSKKVGLENIPENVDELFLKDDFETDARQIKKHYLKWLKENNFISKKRKIIKPPEPKKIIKVIKVEKPKKTEKIKPKTAPNNIVFHNKTIRPQFEKIKPKTSPHSKNSQIVKNDPIKPQFEKIVVAPGIIRRKMVNKNLETSAS